MRHEFEALGTHFAFILFDTELGPAVPEVVRGAEIIVHNFDVLYSRFKSDSLVSQLARSPGVHTVPKDLVQMLRIYEDLYRKTGGKMTPCVGNTLESMGYDATYSLQEKGVLIAVPALPDVLKIIDDTHIEMLQPALLDLGALGKGYVVDLVYDYFMQQSVGKFMVDGSGDIRVHSPGAPVRCGLEDPRDSTKVIGVLSMEHGALCASALNRRAWGERTHYVDPATLDSPTEIAATFVYAETCTVADALSTALFFTAPEEISEYSFEYVLVNAEGKRKSSAFFTELF